jgi:hypothetical protein
MPNDRMMDDLFCTDADVLDSANWIQNTNV